MNLTITLHSPYFLDSGKDREGHDLCAHGITVIEADGCELIRYDGTVSAAALMLLRSTVRDHTIPWQAGEEHMLPCCGHSMIPDETGEKVTILGCCNGCDFSLIHRDEKVILGLCDREPLVLNADDWRQAVLAYAAQVVEFYRISPSRILTKEWMPGGYEAFWREFHSFMNQ